MSKSPHIFWLHALSPLRVGVEASLDAINLPTMREVHTQHPVLPGSSIKGTLRAEWTGQKEQTYLFGPERNNSADHRGALSFTDANLVALPVRSLYGTFAWVTSHFALQRVHRHHAHAGIACKALETLLNTAKDNEILVCSKSKLLSGSALSKVYIEEFEANAKESSELKAAAQALAEEIWPENIPAQDFFVGRLLLLPGTDLDALCVTSLEVRSRVSINPETGTAQTSGPWTEEAMPAETLLVGLVVPRDVRFAKENTINPEKCFTDFVNRFKKPVPLRFGGHSGVGMGRTSFRVVGKAS